MEDGSCQPHLPISTTTRQGKARQAANIFIYLFPFREWRKIKIISIRFFFCFAVSERRTSGLIWIRNSTPPNEPLSRLDASPFKARLSFFSHSQPLVVHRQQDRRPVCSANVPHKIDSFTRLVFTSLSQAQGQRANSCSFLGGSPVLKATGNANKT